MDRKPEAPPTDARLSTSDSREFDPSEFDTDILSATTELTVHLRDRPAPGWLACRASTRFLIDGYHEEDFELWDRTGRLVAQARQLALVSG